MLCRLLPQQGSGKTLIVIGRCGVIRGLISKSYLRTLYRGSWQLTLTRYSSLINVIRRSFLQVTIEYSYRSAETLWETFEPLNNVFLTSTSRR
jgi:hypothetical protein